MAERYQHIDKDLTFRYSEGCPLAIVGSAILKDTATYKILVQIKLKNLVDKTVTSCKVDVKAFEPNGSEVEGVTGFGFFDLCAPCGGEFGSKNPAELPNPASRKVEISVVEVVFADGGVWRDNGGEWSKLTPFKPISSFISSGAIKTYESYFNAAHGTFQYVPEIIGGVAKCACGEIHASSVTRCPKCGKNIKDLIERFDPLGLEKDTVYSSGIKSMALNSIGGYETAIAAFRTIPGWKYADEQINICQKKIEEIKAKEEADRLERERQAEQKRIAAEKAAKKRKKIAAIVLSSVAFITAAVVLFITVFIPTIKHRQAMKLIESGSYDEGYAILDELGKEDEILENKYTRAINLAEDGVYDEAITAFTALDGYKDSAEQITKCETAKQDAQYNNAINLLENGVIIDAYESFISLNGYKDSTEKAKEIFEKYKDEKFKAANVGDIVYFGAYEQDNIFTNGKEDIEWLVLAREDNKVLVISRYALDCQQYNATYTSVTWESCSLREWLNGTFISEAFDSVEQDNLISSTVTADKNPSYFTSPGNNTTDKLFLLSITEVNKYFSSDSDRQCQGTAYCYAQGALKASNGNCWWWLRSPGVGSYSAADVYDDGSVENSGSNSNGSSGAVRPAMWINLD